VVGCFCVFDGVGVEFFISCILHGIKKFTVVPFVFIVPRVIFRKDFLERLTSRTFIIPTLQLFYLLVFHIC
jgi:hypothetical protein